MLLTLGYLPLSPVGRVVYFVFVTFECVDENLWFCHLNETSLGEFHVVLFISQDFMERNLEFFRNFHFALLKD